MKQNNQVERTSKGKMRPKNSLSLLISIMLENGIPRQRHDIKYVSFTFLSIFSFNTSDIDLASFRFFKYVVEIN